MAAVLTAVGLVVPAAQAAGSSDTVGAPAWAVPNESVNESPELLAEGVGRRESAEIVVVTADDRGLHVDTVPADGHNAAVDTISEAQTRSGVVSVGVDQPVEAFGDPLEGQQWALQTMRTPTAWNTTRGNGVVVAVVDSGVDGSHPDLQGALVAGKNTRTERGDYSSPATDADGHGTHVAGIIAARSGNGLGISGVAPQAKVMPIKALDADGTGFMSDVMEGIIWATDKGAGVINVSLGGHDATFADSAVSYALSRGVVVVAAAGNDGSAQPMYPAALPGVLAVAAVDQDGQPAGYSNYGNSWVDVAAPGTDIVSTTPGARYATWTGTSMATPQVAGVAALIRSASPSADAAAVIGSTAYDAGVPGHDRAFGTGVVDASAAVARVAPTPQQPAPAQPVQPKDPVLRTQSVKIPTSVAVRKSKSLPTRTQEGTPIRTWKVISRRKCSVVSRAGAARVVGKRAGVCSLTAAAPAAAGLAAYNGTLRLRVVRR